MGLFTKPVSITLNDGKSAYVRNQKEAYFYAEQFIKIVNDCANLVNTTKNPKVFFERYNLMVFYLENMSKLESFKCFKGKQPSINLKEILSKRESTIDEFIDRNYNDIIQKINSLKTNKAKIKNVENNYNLLSYYKPCMLPNNIQKFVELHTSLLFELNKK